MQLALSAVKLLLLLLLLLVVVVLLKAQLLSACLLQRRQLLLAMRMIPVTQLLYTLTLLYWQRSQYCQLPLLLPLQTIITSY
jgi:hypothetical protein